jgi:RNA polymerase sigma-70 factor (ECF subfamily)
VKTDGTQIIQGALQLAMQITGSRDEAWDVLQAATVKSLEHRNAPARDDQGYRAWFFRVVHNQAIDWLRSQKKFDRSADAELAGESDDDPEQNFSLEQRKMLLHKALNALSPEQREIVCLKDFHDFSYQEIAEIMDLDRAVVATRLHRARLALRDRLIQQRFFTGENDGVS